MTTRKLTTEARRTLLSDVYRRVLLTPRQDPRPAPQSETKDKPVVVAERPERVSRL
ncbi:MAG TPA: hypothetical protein VFL91_18955 [Thermomicrobiales bacterium]|nr:hypothetical protein [Thermomicrobiales bacterium]